MLCAYVFAMVRVTRLSRLRRSAYPLASACCAAKGTVMLTILLGTAVRMSPWKQCKMGAPPKPNEVGLVGKGGATE